MSQSYTQFSQAIPCANQEQVDWLRAELDKWKEGKCEFVSDDDCAPEYEIENPGANAKPEDKGKPQVIVFTEESGSVEGVASLVCAFQDKFKIQEPWYMEAAFYCSK